MTVESVSVNKVRNVLLVSVPPDPEDGIISSLQEKILDSMERYHDLQGLIIDISMVDTMDSYFARTIIETAEMVRLMGGLTIVAGMAPSVAITATQLGLTFENLSTALDVDLALDMMLEKKGVGVFGENY